MDAVGLGIMRKLEPTVPSLLNTPDFDPEQMGASFWHGQYLKQREENQQLQQQLSQLQSEVEQLKEALRKLRRFPPKKVPTKHG